ncbi:golgi matrix protein [Ascosphaera apis ARSEF 7405]|uniref:Golgi matrix protein n=1 Tax=Ascosphaera apis ARSEF 7405 TaxID=392613 RepID=A0A168CZA1_9EURO|nr:golgi matrix protein [Ascosphaera apis ARSEF 7405]
MATGQVSFHSPKLVKKVFVPTRENTIVNRLNKTKVEKYPDLAAEREEYLAQLRREDRKRREEYRNEEKRQKKEYEQLKWQKEHAYDSFMSEDMINQSSNENRSADWEDDFILTIEPFEGEQNMLGLSVNPYSRLKKGTVTGNSPPGSPSPHRSLSDLFTMSADPVSPATQVNAKQRKRNKKKAARAAKANGVATNDQDASPEVADSDGDEPSSPRPGNDSGEKSTDEVQQLADLQLSSDTPDVEGGLSSLNPEDNPISNTLAPTESGPSFDALVRDRDSLRMEVIELRKSLEEIQSKNDDEREKLQESLKSVRAEKENAEHRFRELLGKVNTIKSQLGERLKADAEELTQCRQQIVELEEQNAALSTDANEKAEKISTLTRQNELHEREISELRNRATLAQQNWLQEREDLQEQTRYLQNEFEEAKQAMHNWEILATEERTIRENLNEKVLDVEEQLQAVRADYERAAAECDSQALTIERLQKGIDEIQTARKQELRELAESSDAQIEELKRKIRQAEEQSTEANNKLAATEKELERALPFEKEVREKNLLIGKLRHEAVTLNEHLTKALKFLKKGRVEDNVDRHLVTNYLLQFLSLDRSDPKKFQVLQLIGALLGWSDEEKEQAGLARPGSTTHSTSPFGALRSPTSPMFRNTSTSSLPADYLTAGGSGSRKESLAELWSDFLEQEAQGSEKSSRRPSTSKPPPSH